MGVDQFDAPSEISAEVLAEIDGGTPTVLPPADNTPGLNADSPVNPHISVPGVEHQSIDLDVQSPGVVNLEFHGPKNMTFSVSASGPKISLSCQASPSLIFTSWTQSSANGRAVESGSHSVTCYISFTDLLTSAEAGMPILMQAAIGGAPADGPTGAQKQAAAKPRGTDMPWAEYPGREWIYKLESTMSPIVRQEGTAAEAIMHAGENMECDGHEGHRMGCVTYPSMNPNGPALVSRMWGRWITSNNQRALQCFFVDTPVKSTDPQGNVHEGTIKGIAYKGDVTASAQGLYVAFKDYPDTPKQSAALKAISDGVKTHEEQHMQDNKSFVEGDMKQALTQNLKGETLALLKQKYGLNMGIFTVRSAQVNLSQWQDAKVGCNSVVGSTMNEAMVRLLGSSQDAYTTINGQRKLKANMPQTPLGKLAWRHGWDDLSQIGSLCFRASETDPGQNDSVIQNGCTTGSIQAPWMLVGTIRGIISFASSSHLVYTFQQLL